MTVNKFLILARKRTGSSMLRSALDSHPQITCMGEIFRIDSPLSERAGALMSIRKLTGLESETPEQVENYIRDNPMQFFGDVLARHPDMRLLGCKIFIRHHPGFVEDLSRDESSCIINLERSNALAAYSSQLIANATGKHNLKIGSASGSTDVSIHADTVRAQVDFNADDFDQYRKRIKRSGKRKQKILQDARCKVMNIDYTDLLSSDPFSKVLEFLSVEPDLGVKPRTIKGNSSNILQRFNNPDTVIQYLEKQQLTAWTEEG